MAELSGRKILITGPAGQIAFPLAASLARHNEVWGIARFGNEDDRKRVEGAGIIARKVDLANPDWGDLPGDFDYLLHLAASIAPGLDFDASIDVNGLGTGRLMSRFRDAKACLMMSTSAVYAPKGDGSEPVAETDPMGTSYQPYAPTYCVSKISQEAVTKFCAEEFGLPTTIARMNAAYGDNGGLPAMMLDLILAGQAIPLVPDRVHICAPIHEDDIYAQTLPLLEAAAVPPTITNWAGDEGVDFQEMCRFLGELVAKPVEFTVSVDGMGQFYSDPERRKQLTGPCGVSWKDGMRRMVAARHPNIELSA